MTIPIKTDSYSERLRIKAIRTESKQLLIARIGGSEQELDLTKPANCDDFGRIRHFKRDHGTDWPRNPLPIDPACRALGLSYESELQAQIFQNAACNWRCWYCFVPFPLLEGREDQGGWFTADDLLKLYLREPEPTRAKMIDLTGGQPDLTPEWVPWTMEALRAHKLEGKVYLWSDDNLSNDYFWRVLTDAERSLVATYKGYGKVACFKGFDAESFAFNTEAAPELFDRQFELFARLFQTGIDLYAYVTLTTPREKGICDGVARFVDRLQEIHENLPLRTVPLKIVSFEVVKKRLAGPGRRLATVRGESEQHQFRAVEAWERELESRFPAALRSASIVDIPLR